jgi:hypothetical protein
LPKSVFGGLVHEQQLIRGIEREHRNADLLHHVREQRG